MSLATDRILSADATCLRVESVLISVWRQTLVDGTNQVGINGYSRVAEIESTRI